MHPTAIAALLVVAGLCLGACAGTVVGAGAAVGVSAYQERGIEGAARDTRTTFQILDELFRFDHTLLANVSVEVYEGRALLTGAVTDEAIRADAVRLTWKARGVKDVINEIQVVDDTSLIDSARDTWISAQLRSKLTFDKEVYGVNYAIETVSGIVYLIGIAQDQREIDRVIAHAKGVEHVKRIINHVRLKTVRPKSGRLKSEGKRGA